jgi:type I restriction enzyme M protein
VIDDKWLAAIKGDIQAEIERTTQQLANRVKLLEERYAEPMPKITERVAGLTDTFELHLKKMGLVWS